MRFLISNTKLQLCLTVSKLLRTGQIIAFVTAGVLLFVIYSLGSIPKLTTTRFGD